MIGIISFTANVIILKKGNIYFQLGQVSLKQFEKSTQLLFLSFVIFRHSMHEGWMRCGDISQRVSSHNCSTNFS